MIAARLLRLADGMAGDTVTLSDGVSELRVHFGPGYRIYFLQDDMAIVVLLCGGDKGSQKRDIESAHRLGANGETIMAEKFSPYDPAESLGSDEAIEVFMCDAFETGDASHIATALGVVARAKGMAELAAKTGLSREQLYRSLSANGNPTLKTTLAVIKAIGFSLAVAPDPNSSS